MTAKTFFSGDLAKKLGKNKIIALRRALVKRIPLAYAVAAAFMLLMAFNLFGLGKKAIYAFTNQTTTLFQTVNAGILDVVSASSSQAFGAVNVSFSAQSTTGNLGAFRVEDARGSGAGWAVNLAGNDWKSGEEIEITPRKVVTFKPSIVFKGLVNR